MTLSMNRYADREYYATIQKWPENWEAILDFINGDITYYATGKSLAIFFGSKGASSQSDLIRMGRITSDRAAFESLERMKCDFSELSNVEQIGVDIGMLEQDELLILHQQAQ